MESIKRKRTEPEYKTIKIRKLESYKLLKYNANALVVNVEINNGILKQINIIKKERYYLTNVVFTMDKNLDLNKEIDFSISTRYLKEYLIKTCDSVQDMISKFYCFLLEDPIKTIITYDHSIDEHITIPNCIYLKDYLIKSYFLRSYEMSDIAFLFLNKKGGSSIDECLQITELLYALCKHR